MSNVEFETDFDPSKQIMQNRSNQASGLAALLMKLGIIKDESQAGAVMLGIIVINLAIMAFVIYYFFF